MYCYNRHTHSEIHISYSDSKGTIAQISYTNRRKCITLQQQESESTKQSLPKDPSFQRLVWTSYKCWHSQAVKRGDSSDIFSVGIASP